MTFDGEERAILAGFEYKWHEAPTSSARKMILFSEVLNPMFDYKTCGHTKLLDSAAACDYAEVSDSLFRFPDLFRTFSLTCSS